MTALRVGIAGCGMIAGGPVRGGRPIAGTHAEACAAVAGVELVSASDPDDGRRNAFGAYWHVRDLYASTDEMFALAKLDLVIVATPPGAHFAVCKRAVESGARGILCEKPFTGSAKLASEIVSMCERANVKLAVNFTRRWDESHQALAAAFARGDLGAPRTVFGVYTGSLRGNGSHLIDTLAMLAPESWSIAWTSELAPEAEDGAVSATLRSDRGTLAFLDCAAVDYFVFELHVLAARGRARLLRQGNEIWMDAPAPHPDYPGYHYLTASTPLPSDTLPGAFPAVLASLAAAVRTGALLAYPAAAAVRTLDLVDRIALHAQGAR